MSNNSTSAYNWANGFTIDFSLATGMSKKGKSTTRHLSQMKTMYYDTAAADTILQAGDVLVYEFYELGAPDNAGDLAFGTSITYPGKVGDEYFMTKGHFHTILETAEVYYTLSGRGIMLTESPGGDVVAHELTPGCAVYVPQRYAHRSINTGDTPLVTFFVFRGDAGHDYGTIETKGYRKLVVEQNGKPTLVDNPKWSDA
ncbi:MAG: cupin domain-containing protein [Planctomycetaceae bacterium]|nr:cupin domain-containing protein [Planctomycetaceae bacterium]